MQEARLTNYQCTNDKFQGFYNELLEDITHNRIILPSIPDVVFKIRQAINEPKTDLNTLVAVLSTDTAMSARVLKVANSALYKRHSDDSDDLRAAIMRLGTSLVNTLVTNLAIIQTLRTPFGPVAHHLEQLFKHSIDVAAYCYALAKCYTRINSEQAILAGIVHDIGYLPILQKAYNHRLVWQNEEYLDELLRVLHAPVGGFVLQAWGFGTELVNTSIKHENQFYNSPLGPDLIDLVIVSDYLTEYHAHKNVLEISNIAAFSKIGVESAEEIKSNDEFKTLVAEASLLFKI